MSDVMSLVGKIVMKDLVIDEYIGSGGFGDVYKAHSQLGNTKLFCAVKHLVIPNEREYQDQLKSHKNDKYATDEYFRMLYDDVINEINLMHQLSGKSKNVIAYQHYEIEGPLGDPKHYEIFIKMEYLTSMETYCLTKNMTAEEVLRLGIDIASALDACHSEDIVHRDVKTANIFVNDRGVFKLGDFGLAKKLTDSSRAKSKVGTDAYKAPEIFNPYGKYDKTVDMYSLGVVLFEMFNHGRLPFMPDFPNVYGPRDVEEAVERRVRGEGLPRPMEAPQAVVEIISKVCALSPSDRYQTANDLRQALQKVLDESSKEELSRIVSQATTTEAKVKNASKETPSSQFGDSFGKANHKDESYVNVDMFASHDGKSQRENTNLNDKDRQLWEFAKKDGSEKALRGYLNESLTKTYALDAWALLDQMYWNKANLQGTKKAYKAYLSSDIIGKKYVDKAQEKISQFDAPKIKVKEPKSVKQPSSKLRKSRFKRALIGIAALLVIGAGLFSYQYYRDQKALRALNSTPINNQGQVDTASNNDSIDLSNGTNSSSNSTGINSVSDTGANNNSDVNTDSNPSQSPVPQPETPTEQYMTDMVKPTTDNSNDIKIDPYNPNLSIAGKQYAKGVRFYASRYNSMKFYLNGNYRRVTGLMGIDDSDLNHSVGTMSIGVFGDGKKITSFNFTLGNFAQVLNIDVIGVKILEFRADQSNATYAFDLVNPKLDGDISFESLSDQKLNSLSGKNMSDELLPYWTRKYNNWNNYFESMLKTNSIMTMDGKEYRNGYQVTNGDSNYTRGLTFNLGGKVKEISGLLGRDQSSQDGLSAATTVRFWAGNEKNGLVEPGGKELAKINIGPGFTPQEFTLNVDGIELFEVEITDTKSGQNIDFANVVMK